MRRRGATRETRATAIAAVALALSIAPAAAIAGTFDAPDSSDTQQQFQPGNVQRQDTPNDPDYDQCEPDSGGPCNLFDERFDLFGFPSALTPFAIYNDPGDPARLGKRQISGFNAAGAWKATRGQPDVEIAILDTGINWDKCGLRDRIRLNAGELTADQRPWPAAATAPDRSAGLGGRDLNRNGYFDVDDYKDDSRVGREFPTKCGGQVTAKDLINAFSDGTDADGNGYVDDIAGWNHFDDNNDPTDRSSYFAAENHGDGRALEAVEKGNDGQGSIGVCPKCMFVPMRIWDTFVADANNFGMAVLYAADNGIEVVEGADGALYHSAFMEAASQYAYEKGVAQVYSGNDLNTGNHNYPANYDHTMLIEGVAADVEGLGTNPGQAQRLLQLGCTPAVCTGSNAPVRTYFRGANTTQFGGHSSVSMHGPTGSTNTGKAAGAVGLVISAARERGVELTPDESRAIIEQTAEDVLPANTIGTGNPDPAQAGWDEHFGYGRVDLGKAVGIARNDDPPPEASIESPDWYAPLTGDRVQLDGRLKADYANGGRFHYKVEWGPGLAPRDGIGPASEWRTIAEGDASGTVTNLGQVPLDQVRAALAVREPPPDTAGPVFGPSRNPFKDQFTVRVTVTGDGVATRGVDRKVLTALPDGQRLRPGFPRRLGTGGEAPLRYADLNGDNVEELIAPLEDGTVHAYTRDGDELPGWPVETEVQYSATEHGAAPAFDEVDQPREPPRGPTIADLDDDGSPEVITAAGLRIYVFEADGSLRDGFPVRNDPDFCDPADQRKENAQGGAWHRKCGFIATPSVGRIEGADKPLNIVAPSLDGHLYVLREDGTSVPGFPVDLVDPNPGDDPQPDPDKQRFAESINQPAIGDIGGGPDGAPDGRDDIIAASNEAYGGSSGGGDVSFAGLLSNVGGQSTRVYAINGATGDFMPGWPIEIPGLIQNVLPLIGPGHDPALVNVDGEQKIVASATSGSLATYNPDGSQDTTMNQDRGLNLFESAAVGDLTGAGRPNLVKYQVDIEQAANLLLVGQNFPYSHRIGAWEPASGQPLAPGWPTITDDYQFLSSSTVAKVDPNLPSNQVLAGTGLGLMHAYDGATGKDVPGFPKVTGGWLFAPAALSADGRMAGITREGFLFEWENDAPPCQSEWPSFRHDPQGSGNYDRDGTAPGANERFRLERLGGNRYRVLFNSAGDDGMCGTPERYVTRIDGEPIDLGLSDPAAGGEPYEREATLPAGTPGDAVLSIQAYDEAGNGGFRSSVRLRQATVPAAGGAGDAGAGDAGAGGPGAGGPCIDRAAPAAVLARRSTRVSRRRVNVFGTAKDAGCTDAGNVARVQIAVAQRVRGGCRFLKRNRRLSARKRCAKPHYMNAKVGYSTRLKASPFRLKQTRLKLPAGLYAVTVRPIDAHRNAARPRARAVRVR